MRGEERRGELLIPSTSDRLGEGGEGRRRREVGSKTGVRSGLTGERESKRNYNSEGGSSVQSVQSVAG